MFTARYGLSAYLRQICLVLKGLIPHVLENFYLFSSTLFRILLYDLLCLRKKMRCCGLFEVMFTKDIKRRILWSHFVQYIDAVSRNVYLSFIYTTWQSLKPEVTLVHHRLAFPDNNNNGVRLVLLGSRSPLSHYVLDYSKSNSQINSFRSSLWTEC